MKTKLIKAIITQAATLKVEVTDTVDKRYKGGLRYYNRIEIFNQLTLKIEYKPEMYCGSILNTNYGEFVIVAINKITLPGICDLVSMVTNPIQQNPIVILGDIEYEFIVRDL